MMINLGEAAAQEAQEVQDGPVIEEVVRDK